MVERLRVGLIVKPQGVRGEVKVQPLTDDINRFKKLNKVFIDGVQNKVGGVKIADGFCILSILGVTDRNDAELLRGKYIEVERADADELPKDRYFITDIIGCRVVFEDDKELGEVTEVTSAKTDIFTLKTVSNKVVRFPFLKDLLVSVDVEQKVIKILRKRYLEVCCYED
jgi:16S rRNA processing protein RimM